MRMTLHVSVVRVAGSRRLGQCGRRVGAVWLLSDVDHAPGEHRAGAPAAGG
jgi:hypothetical protein